MDHRIYCREVSKGGSRGRLIRLRAIVASLPAHIQIQNCTASFGRHAILLAAAGNFGKLPPCAGAQGLYCESILRYELLIL